MSGISKRRKAGAGPASLATSQQKPKRIEHNKKLLAQELHLDSSKALNQWLASDVVAPIWNSFLAHGYHKKKGKAKQWDHFVVYRRMKEGESAGQCRFSAFNSSPEKFPDYLDCLAWLLYQLLKANTERMDGAFFRKNVPEAQRVRTIWYVILHLIWSQSGSRVGANKSSKTEPGQSARSATQQVAGDDGNAEEEEEQGEGVIDATSLDPEKGEMRVVWSDQPDEVEDEGVVSAVQVVKKFCRFTTQDAFFAHISDLFKLGDIQHVIRRFTVEDEDVISWDKLLRQAHDTPGRLKCQLSTEKMEAVPEGIINQPATEAPHASSDRKMMWAAMLDHVRQTGASTFDISVPFWQFHLLRVVASGREEFDLMNIRLDLEDQASVGLGDRMVEGMTDLSMSDEVNEQAAQMARESRGEVQGIEWAMSLEHMTLEHMTGILHGGDEIDEDADINEDAEDDDSPPPHSMLHEITSEERDVYKEHVQWLHSKDYERDNHAQACTMLQISNPERPRLPDMRPTAQLRHHQPTGIYALHEFEESDVGGGIEADEVGTGKSYTLTGLVLHSARVRKARIDCNFDVGPALPTLLLVPKGLIRQWTDVIRSMTDKLTVITYYGNASSRWDGSVKHQGKERFDRTDIMFDPTKEKNASLIIISTVATWATRHGPTAQAKWLPGHLGESRPYMNNAEIKKLIRDKYPESVLQPQFPGNMAGCIGRIILDEGHELRHQPEVFGTAIDWLRAPKRILVSATPWRKNYKEFAGIMHFVMNPKLRDGGYLKELGFPAEQCEAENPLEKVLHAFNPFEADDDDGKAQLRYTDVALRGYIFGPDHIESAENMRKVLREVLIRRSYASTVDGKRIDEDLPEVQRTTIRCKFTSAEQILYDDIYKTFVNKLFAMDEKDVVWSSATYRQLCMVTSWIFFQFLRSYKVKEMKKFRTAKKNATHMLKDIAKEQKRLKTHVVNIPPRDDPQATLSALTNGSPKLRALLHLLSDIVVLQKEKVILWVQFPAQMEWLRCALADAGFSVECLYADLKADAREKMTTDFHTNPDGFKILIASYMVSSAGLNLHGFCRTCIEFDPAPDEATRIQIVGRVQRIGQIMWIRHIILLVDKSFDTRRAAVAMLQNLPGLATQLNLDLWGSGDNTQTSLGEWVLDNGVLRKADDPLVQGKDVKQLSPQELLLHIQQRLIGADTESLDTVKKASVGIFE